MATVRDERADAIQKLNRLFADDFRAAQAALLDKLDAIDARHEQPPAAISFSGEMTEEQAAEFKRQWDERWSGTAPAGQAAVPVKPAPRRRTARKDGE